MKYLTSIGIYLFLMAFTALGFYELTAKSTTWLGQPLPGWRESRQVERSTRWDPPTGILPLDKLLHESQEACRFYGLLTHPGQNESQR